MKKRNILVTILAIVMMFQCSIGIMPVNAVTTAEKKVDASIDDDVYSSATYEDGKYLVCLWRDSISESVIEKNCLKITITMHLYMRTRTCIMLLSIQELPMRKQPCMVTVVPIRRMAVW